MRPPPLRCRCFRGGRDSVVSTVTAQRSERCRNGRSKKPHDAAGAAGGSVSARCRRRRRRLGSRGMQRRRRPPPARWGGVGWGSGWEGGGKAGGEGSVRSTCSRSRSAPCPASPSPLPAPVLRAWPLSDACPCGACARGCARRARAARAAHLPDGVVRVRRHEDDGPVVGPPAGGGHVGEGSKLTVPRIFSLLPCAEEANLWQTWIPGRLRPWC